MEGLGVVEDAAKDEGAFDLDDGLLGPFTRLGGRQAALFCDLGEGFEPGLQGSSEDLGKFCGSTGEREHLKGARHRAVYIAKSQLVCDGAELFAGISGLFERLEDVLLEPRVRSLRDR
jgi:hypothetical protein